MKKPVSKKDSVLHGPSLLTEHDIYLFKEGNHFGLYEKLGSHLMRIDEADGTFFAVWAPNAARVSVIGDFNDWNNDSHHLSIRHDGSGIWEGFIPGVGNGALYKYHIVSRHRGHRGDKGDPFAFPCETPPRTSSLVWDLAYDWSDDEW